VDDPLGMRGSQSLSDLQGVIRCLADRQQNAALFLIQRATFQQLADEIRSSFMYTSIVNRQDVGMIQRRERFCLLLEASQAICVPHYVIR
jgi:hypothetical protein